VSTPSRRGFTVALCIATVLAISGCASANRSAARAAGGTTIGITERDFRVTATLAHVSAGAITLRIHNQGPDQHELIVAPDRSGGMPIRADGFTVNEEAIQSSEPGSITPQQPGGTEDLAIQLAPGRYELFCNMEGHYMGGMHTLLTVS
jgi:uncharacterized cupredoxin-like copper-binding protein